MKRAKPLGEVTFVPVRRYDVRVCDLDGAETTFNNACLRGTLSHLDGGIVTISLNGESNRPSHNTRYYPLAQLRWFEQIEVPS